MSVFPAERSGTVAVTLHVRSKKPLGHSVSEKFDGESCITALPLLKFALIVPFIVMAFGPVEGLKFIALSRLKVPFLIILDEF